jgi:hypothetical protein
MKQPSITISGDKESEFEFDVALQGIPAKELTVRFVLEGAAGYDVAINCVQKAKTKWSARIPSMQLHESMQHFRIEVIAGSYYFCPANGNITVVAKPTVKVAEMIQRVYQEKKMEVSVLSEVTSARPTAILEKMDPTARMDLFKRCRAAGKLFVQAGSMLQVPIIEHKKLNAQALVEMLELVKKAMKLIEVKVYL